MTLISSRDNPLIREYVHLRESAGFRRKSGAFVLEGARLCKDALESGVRLRNAFITESAVSRESDLTAALAAAGARVFTVTDAIGRHISDTAAPQGIFCTAFMLDKVFELNTINLYGAYLALENLQDPGNLGTVLRTAEALGLEGVILSQGCADVYAPKVVRATMGAVFRLPFCRADDLPALLKALSDRGMTTLAAAAGAAKSVTVCRAEGGVVAVIGNEGAGLTEACIAACREAVRIPMRGRAESLNAAAAAAILLWEIMKDRPGA